jgi:hypothetical protein
VLGMLDMALISHPYSRQDMLAPEH